MKRTRPTSLIGLAVAGLVVGFLAELAASASSRLRPIFTALLTLISLSLAMWSKSMTYGGNTPPQSVQGTDLHAARNSFIRFVNSGLDFFALAM